MILRRRKTTLVLSTIFSANHTHTLTLETASFIFRVGGFIFSTGYLLAYVLFSPLGKVAGRAIYFFVYCRAALCLLSDDDDNRM